MDMHEELTLRVLGRYVTLERDQWIELRALLAPNTDQDRRDALQLAVRIGDLVGSRRTRDVQLGSNLAAREPWQVRERLEDQTFRVLSRHETQGDAVTAASFFIGGLYRRRDDESGTRYLLYAYAAEDSPMFTTVGRLGEEPAVDAGVIVPRGVDPATVFEPAELETYPLVDERGEACRREGAAGAVAPVVLVRYPPGVGGAVAALPASSLRRR